MSLMLIIVLAIVQGIAEFLPISSSGHLVIIAAIAKGLDPSTRINLSDVSITLHFGTLVSIAIFYRQRIWDLLFQDRRTIWLLILGTIPAATIGLLIKRKFSFLLGDPLLAGSLLIANGAMLWWMSRAKPQDGRYNDLPEGKTLGIGLAQAIAILPGISRSGSTMAAGVAAGLSRADAATFSFLLAIPAITGASVLEGFDLITGESVATTSYRYLAIGACISFVIGLGALQILVRMLEMGRMIWFAYWSVLVGIGVVTWAIVR